MEAAIICSPVLRRFVQMEDLQIMGEGPFSEPFLWKQGAKSTCCLQEYELTLAQHFWQASAVDTAGPWLSEFQSDLLTHFAITDLVQSKMLN